MTAAKLTDHGIRDQTSTSFLTNLLAISFPHTTFRQKQGSVGMQDQLNQLVTELLAQANSLESDARLLVGVSGFPGSGKSILATKLVSALNASSSSSPIAICVGMDGWHYPRSVLSTFSDPKLAFDRRGSEWTFDSTRFADFVSSVKRNPTSTLKAPSFDHAEKDPLQDGVLVLPSHKVVVFEGLYCNCSVGEWGRAAKEMDRRLVFEMDKEEAKRRLVVRHVATGVAKDEDEAIWRGEFPITTCLDFGKGDQVADVFLTLSCVRAVADNNDLPNGDWLMSHLLEPYTVVRSIDDPTWR